MNNCIIGKTTEHKGSIVSEKTQLFVGVRRMNGQIGYLSESLTIPEFFDLIRPHGEAGINLVDFSPVIETLHSLHEKGIEQSIREKYNAVFNYWQESKSYSKIEIKMPKLESLSLLSNELIVSLLSRIEESKSKYRHRRNTDPKENLNIVNLIKMNSDAFIDILLCFIHSKASLEIESFKNDATLTKYCDSLKKIISSLYYTVVEYDTWNDNFELESSSLLYHLAFNNDPEMECYTTLLPCFDNSLDLRLSLLCQSKNKDSYSSGNEDYTTIQVDIRTPSRHEVNSAKILRDILYKINSISRLLERLKEGDVKWNAVDGAAEELKHLISNHGDM